MYVHNLNPVAIHLGPLSIRWYGLMYVLALLVFYWYCKRAIRREEFKITTKQLDSLLTWVVISMIIGARVFEVLFWEQSYFLSNPGEILKFWKGGLSFHGGLVGIVIAVIYWCRKNKVRFLNLADITIVPLALGQAFGRIGNFINGELWGKVTTMPWGVIFPGAEGIRHPSQLYEAAYDILIFGILLLLSNRKHKEGSIFAWFLILYAVCRSLTDLFREPTVMIGPLTLGQALNIPMFFAGLWLLKRHK